MEKRQSSEVKRKGEALAILLSFLSLLWVGFLNEAHAVPSRTEVYRSDKLRTIVYKDRSDDSAFWFVPPVKLYQEKGTAVFYRKPQADGKVKYSFYVVPFMDDNYRQVLSGEIPGFQNSSQLKPVIARGFGIQVKQFDTVSYIGEKITDFQYLNNPHLIQLTLAKSQAEEFDFFFKHKPGIQANVLIDFETEKVQKDLKLELSSKEIYNTLKVGVGARIVFVQAELEKSITDALAKKYLNVVGKGDLAPPDFVKNVIKQCFDPVKKQGNNTWDPDDDSWKNNYDPVGAVAPDPADLQAQQDLADSLIFPQTPPNKSIGGDDEGGSSGGGGFQIPGMGGTPGKTSDGVFFTFKKELINADRSCGFTSVQWMDSSEILGIPVYLTSAPEVETTGVKISNFPRKEITVDGESSSAQPVSTGITVNSGDQFILTSDFACIVTGSYFNRYQPQIPALVWNSAWGNPDGDVYYRVGTGPWNPIGQRALIKSDSVYTGEIQLYVDKQKVWEKIPSDLKKSRFLAPAIVTYQTVNPRYIVAINGRRVELK